MTQSKSINSDWHSCNLFAWVKLNTNVKYSHHVIFCYLCLVGYTFLRWSQTFFSEWSINAISSSKWNNPKVLSPVFTFFFLTGNSKNKNVHRRQNLREKRKTKPAVIVWSSESALSLLTHAANQPPPAPHSAWHYILSGWVTAAFSMCMTSDSLFWVNLDQELLFPGHRYGITDNAKFLTPLYLQLRSNPHERVPTLNIAFLNQPDKLNVLYSEGLLLPCSDICTCYRVWMKSISRMLMTIL